jgi:hypothetical protein
MFEVESCASSLFRSSITNGLEEKRHRMGYHGSQLHQRLAKLRPSSIALLKHMSFSVSRKISEGGRRLYIYDSSRRMPLPYGQLNPTRITFYSPKDCKWRFNIKSILTFLALIESMKSLLQIEWIEFKHPWAGEPDFAHYRQRFPYHF